MASREWDYALQIKGVSFDSLGLSRLADYMKEFAALLGEDARPVFAGAVRGSVILRVREQSPHPVLTKTRVKNAAHAEDAPGGIAYQKINGLMRRDGARGQLVDREQNVIVSFAPRPAANDSTVEIVIPDEGMLDGVVVGISGIDDTVHVRIQESSGQVHSVSIRDMSLAKELAIRFRSDVIRLHVHGTWKRTAAGEWLPHTLHGDRFEDLKQGSAHDDFLELAAIPGNGWSSIADADELWQKIRGIDDSSA